MDSNGFPFCTRSEHVNNSSYSIFGRCPKIPYFCLVRNEILLRLPFLPVPYTVVSLDVLLGTALNFR